MKPVDVPEQPAEVLTEEARHERQREEDRGEDGQPLHVRALAHRHLRLLDRDDGHVGLQDRCQQVSLGGDLLVHQQQVVTDVPQVGQQVTVTSGPFDGAEDRQQGVDRPVEVGDLTPKEVDALGGRHLAGEDGALDLLDVPLQLGDDRGVALDHLVEDGPQRGGRPEPQQLRMLLEPLPRGVQLTGHTLPDGDDERRSHEDADLAEVHLLTGVVVPRGTQDDELDGALVLLDLRAQVEGLRVLHRELVEAEAPADLVQLGRAGLEHAQPDEAVVPALLCRDLQAHGGVALPPPVAVVGAVDDHDTTSGEPARHLTPASRFNARVSVLSIALRARRRG